LYNKKTGGSKKHLHHQFYRRGTNSVMLFYAVFVESSIGILHNYSISSKIMLSQFYIPGFFAADSR